MSAQPNRAAQAGASAATAAPQSQSRRRGANKPPRSKGAPPRTDAASTSNATWNQASSVAPTASTSASRKRKKKESGSGQDKAAGDNARLKVVVRRLPPNLPAPIFWKAVAPWVNDGKVRDSDEKGGPPGAGRTADWLSFVPGKLKTRDVGGGTSSFSHHRHSRAYIRFLNAQHLADFHRNFDGHIFRDAKGTEHAAVVEFAPYQKVPADSGRRKKRDPRQGTIDHDADYQSFLESLKAEAPGPGEQSLAEKTEAQLLAHLAASDGAAMAERAKNTPLLEHLRQQRALHGRRGREGKSSKVKGKERSSKRKTPGEVKTTSAKKKERVRNFNQKKAEAEAANAASSSKPPKEPGSTSKKPAKPPKSKSKPTRATDPTPQPSVAPQVILKRQAPANTPSSSAPPTGPSARPQAAASSAANKPSGPSIPTGPAASSRGGGGGGRNMGRSRGGGRGGGRGGAAT